MTRKDYELIARVLRDPTLHLQDSKRRALASRFADELEADNWRFDRERFLKACGVSS
jgi:hypothetical protein